MVRVTAADVPVPMAETLEDAAIPNVARDHRRRAQGAALIG